MCVHVHCLRYAYQMWYCMLFFCHFLAPKQSLMHTHTHTQQQRQICFIVNEMTEWIFIDLIFKFMTCNVRLILLSIGSACVCACKFTTTNLLLSLASKFVRRGSIAMEIHHCVVICCTYSCAIAVKVITVEQQKNGRFSWKSSLSGGLLTLINKHKRKSSRREGAKERENDEDSSRSRNCMETSYNHLFIN